MRWLEWCAKFSSMKRMIVLFACGACIGIIGASFFYFGMFRRDAYTQDVFPFIKPSVSQTQTDLQTNVPAEFVNQAFLSSTATRLTDGTRILLLPHHAVAAKYIAALLSSVSTRPRRIILLTPDHLGVGRTDVTVGDGALAFDGHIVETNPSIAKKILSAVPRARADEIAIRNELSVQALLPFLAHAFPKSSITPVLLKIGHDTDERESLSIVLKEILENDPNVLLVSSVDFSHDLPAEVADFHDVLAQDVVMSLEDREADRVELDSAGVLSVTLRVARETGLGNVTIHAHTNSLRILQSELAQESTSHILASFAPGPVQSSQRMALLFTGDIMLDRTVKDRMNLSSHSDVPFENILGQENRFFRGQDAVIGNLEGPVTSARRPPEKEIDFAFASSVPALLRRVGFDAVSQANNHALDQGRDGADDSHAALLRAGMIPFGDQVRDDATSSLAFLERRGQSVALIGLNDSDRRVQVETVVSVIQEARKKADYVVVFIHWGEEYRAKPTLRQQELAYAFIDAGADAIIGSHPHWMESVEVYKGKPIAYSLGNFVFDQDWSPETQRGLVAGLVLSKQGFELHLFPVDIVKSRPVLLVGKARQERLEYLAGISDPALTDQIKTGVITTLSLPLKVR